MRQMVSIAMMVLAVALVFLASFSARHVAAQEPTLAEMLPTGADLGPAWVVVDDRGRTLVEQAAAFSDADEAARLLTGWAWQENVFRVFQSAALTAAGAPLATVDISLTRFASTEGAANALPYFLDDRAAALGQRAAANPPGQPAVGDEMRFVTGSVENGDDTTLYARSGPLLLRISATAVPEEVALVPGEIAAAIFGRGAAASPPVTGAQATEEWLFSADALPLDDAACFRVAGEGTLDVPAVAERLATAVTVSAALDDLGWGGGSYRQFTCDPAPGHAGWIDMSVHRFPDAGAAAAAVAMFADTRARGMDLDPVKVLPLGESDAALTGPAVNGTEYTRYVSRGSRLFAITAVAPVGDPRADVDQIAAALVGLPAPAPDAVPAAPTPTPFALDAAPTVAPLPTATPIPLPTATAVPTATFVPAPAAIPIPTATPTEPPPPTMISVVIATAVPTATPAQPTPTAAALPTPTPRVIHIPPPATD